MIFTFFSVCACSLVESQQVSSVARRRLYERIESVLESISKTLEPGTDGVRGMKSCLVVITNKYAGLFYCSVWTFLHTPLANFFLISKKYQLSSAGVVGFDQQFYNALAVQSLGTLTYE